MLTLAQVPLLHFHSLGMTEDSLGWYWVWCHYKWAAPLDKLGDLESWPWQNIAAVLPQTHSWTPSHSKKSLSPGIYQVTQGMLSHAFNLFLPLHVSLPHFSSTVSLPSCSGLLALLPHWHLCNIGRVPGGNTAWQGFPNFAVVIRITWEAFKPPPQCPDHILYGFSQNVQGESQTSVRSWGTGFWILVLLLLAV